MWEFNDAINSRKSLLSGMVGLVSAGDEFEENIEPLCRGQTAIVGARCELSLLVAAEDLHCPIHSSSLSKCKELAFTNFLQIPVLLYPSDYVLLIRRTL